MSRHTLRIIKVGGSLLSWPDLPSAMWRWLQSQANGANLLLAGGGELADSIRQMDARFGLGEELSHQLCLKAMEINGACLERFIAQARIDFGNEAPDEQRSIQVIDVLSYLADPDISARLSLPHTWEVTSDSIAARLANAFAATELVLLKSCSLVGSMDFKEAQARQVVDPYFSTAAAAVAKIRFVNLRKLGWPDWILYPHRDASQTSSSSS